MDDKNVKLGSESSDEQSTNSSTNLADVYQQTVDNKTSTEPGKEQETQETTQEKGKQEGLTEDKISEIFDKKFEEGFRRFQSFGDKRDAALRQLIADNKELIEKRLGRPLSEEESQTVEDNTRKDVSENPDQLDVKPVSAQEQGTSTLSNEAQQEFVSKIQALEIKYSVRVTPQDEEYKTIDWNEKDHLKIVSQIEAAMKAKAGRMSPEQLQADAQSRLPAGTNDASPDDLKGKSISDLLGKAYSNKKYE